MMILLKFSQISIDKYFMIRQLLVIKDVLAYLTKF